MTSLLSLPSDVHGNIARFLQPYDTITLRKTAKEFSENISPPKKMRYFNASHPLFVKTYTDAFLRARTNESMIDLKKQFKITLTRYNSILESEYESEDGPLQTCITVLYFKLLTLSHSPADIEDNLFKLIGVYQFRGDAYYKKKDDTSKSLARKYIYIQFELAKIYLLMYLNEDITFKYSNILDCIRIICQVLKDPSANLDKGNSRKTLLVCVMYLNYHFYYMEYPNNTFIRFGEIKNLYSELSKSGLHLNIDDINNKAPIENFENCVNYIFDKKNNLYLLKSRTKTGSSSSLKF
jgi:hypothetical protein